MIAFSSVRRVEDGEEEKATKSDDGQTSGETSPTDKEGRYDSES